MDPVLKRLWIGLFLCVMLGIAIESNRGTPARSGEPVLIEDPAGRRLMLLVVDSLSVPNFKKMPALQALAADGFSAQIEPCLERITYVCVKESLTGRTAFTLFGLFQNFGVGATDPGDNLLRDARAAGKQVAMVSAGDLKPFHGDIDANKVYKKGPSEREEKRVIALMETADVLVYHYIWHDTEVHHTTVGSKRYKKSVRRTNKLIERMAEALPEDMDLIVYGDHGHAKDGRHVQGLDIPSMVVAVSPNIAKLKLPAEPIVPISAVRFLSGASSGLVSDRVDWSPAWESWLGPELSEQTRSLVRSGSAPTGISYPLGATVVCVLSVLLASGAGRRWWAVALATVGIAMGIGFEAWMAWIHFPKGLPRINTVLYWVPVAGALLGLAIGRSRRSMWLGTVACCTALGLTLFPVVHHYGVLKNLGNLLAPLLIVTGLAALSRSSWRDRALIVLGAGLTAWAIYRFSDFRIFNLEIVKYKAMPWLRRAGVSVPLLTAVLAAGVHAALERKRLTALGLGVLAAVGAYGVLKLPDYAYILPVLAVMVGIWWKGPSKGRILSLGTAWAGPFVFSERALLGVYATVVLVGIGLWLVRKAEDEETAKPSMLARWAGGTLIMLGGYMGMAWTYGLTVTGIDFTFAIHWLPGRLHEQLWWVIALLTTWKVLAHVPLIVVLTQRIYGDQARAIADTAAGFGLLRYAVIACFATAWLVASGEQAGGLRLAAMLQDGFYWLVLGLLMAALIRRGSPPVARESP
jgi:hypothetical protein